MIDFAHPCRAYSTIFQSKAAVSYIEQLTDRKTPCMGRNRLSEETSPYLLQHAENPVHWFGWGPVALSAANEHNRPILLSIGYAACHWCHVMAHECFENQAIAEQMNTLFVNIKVDREERPDIDAIYQQALQLLGQQGGWPLTMFLTPAGEPFWGGTYFPPDSRYGRPGFPQVLSAISDHWLGKPEKAYETAKALTNGLQRAWATELSEAKSTEIPLTINDEAAVRIAEEFDMVDGGFGKPPKFPNPSIHELLWRSHLRTGDEALRDAVLVSLTKMSQGGIYDHLGGGFSRYSTDAIWLTPHFEKMLYDNAQIIDLLVWSWQGTGNPLFAQRAEETIDWCLREMVVDAGTTEGRPFAASYDADSEGEEGKFYVWSISEINEVLGDCAESLLFKTIYNVSSDGNWDGHNILNRISHPDLLNDDQEGVLAVARRKLLAVRNSRTWPDWDDKVLADWNGMMIASMAHAAVVFNRPDWLHAAISAFAFVRDCMQRDGRLMHAFRLGKLKHSATLDDYANMSRAAVALYEATGDKDYIRTARHWVKTMNVHFWDTAKGGYFFTADDAEALIIRTKTAADNATPAGNSVIAATLIRLHYLTGEDAFRTRAENIFTAFAGEVSKNFFPLAGLLCANEMLQCATQVVIIGDPAKAPTKALTAAAWRASNMNKIVQCIAPNQTLPDDHPASGKKQVAGKPTAYVCIGRTCSLPLTDPTDLSVAI